MDKPSVLGLTSAMMRCKIHGVPIVCFCPACRGAARSRSKAAASRRNGKLGGRPRKARRRNAR